MVGAYSEEQRQSARALLEAGDDIVEVSTKTSIPLAVLCRWFKLQLAAPAKRQPGGGRKPVIDEAGLLVLREIVQASGRLTLDELAVAFTARTAKSVKTPAIAKAMKELGFRKVKLGKAPSKPASQSPPRYTKAHRREPTKTAYPSTLTDLEWSVLEPLLAKAERRGRPPKHDKRTLLDAIFYQVRTGTQWRYIPKDFPPWPAVWSAFRRLRDSETLERMYDALHQQCRLASGRSATPSAGIVDSQTVKKTEKGGLAATTPARRSRATNAIWSLIPLDFPAQS